MAGKRPDWRLTAVEKETNRKGYIGAGWSNEKGGISIRLDPGVILSWKDDLTIMLWPADSAPPKNTESDEGRPPF